VEQMLRNEWVTDMILGGVQESNIGIVMGIYSVQTEVNYSNAQDLRSNFKIEFQNLRKRN